MGGAEHEAAARNEEHLARQHAAQYDPNARDEPRCDPAAETVCWTPTTNPTEPHASEARRHDELATEHRAASRALRETEARACAAIAAADRAKSPFQHPEDIRRVTVLTESSLDGPLATTRAFGIQVEFRAVPGLTTERLRRLVDCHSARNATIGYATTASSSQCPLAVGPVDADVRETEDGFAVTIVPVHGADVDAVVGRGTALVHRPDARLGNNCVAVLEAWPVR